MNLSPGQISTFWRLWPQACRMQGWPKAEHESQRKEFLLRCGFRSLTEVDKLDGFTKVLRELEILIRPSINSAREADDLTINRARTIRWVIRNEILPCLALYKADPQSFLDEIINDRFNKLRRFEKLTLDDLDARPIPFTDRRGKLVETDSQLDQVRMTVNARLNTLRNEAGDTIHEMKIRAQVKCTCSRCLKAVASVTLDAVLEEEIPSEKIPF